jgi:hypothetical protein
MFFIFSQLLYQTSYHPKITSKLLLLKIKQLLLLSDQIIIKKSCSELCFQKLYRKRFLLSCLYCQTCTRDKGSWPEMGIGSMGSYGFGYSVVVCTMEEGVLFRSNIFSVFNLIHMKKFWSNSFITIFLR